MKNMLEFVFCSYKQIQSRKLKDKIVRETFHLLCHSLSPFNLKASTIFKRKTLNGRADLKYNKKIVFY